MDGYLCDDHFENTYDNEAEFKKALITEPYRLAPTLYVIAITMALMTVFQIGVRFQFVHHRNGKAEVHDRILGTWRTPDYCPPSDNVDDPGP